MVFKIPKQVLSEFTWRLVSDAVSNSSVFTLSLYPLPDDENHGTFQHQFFRVFFFFSFSFLVLISFKCTVYYQIILSHIFLYSSVLTKITKLTWSLRRLVLPHLKSLLNPFLWGRFCWGKNKFLDLKGWVRKIDHNNV